MYINASINLSCVLLSCRFYLQLHSLGISVSLYIDITHSVYVTQLTQLSPAVRLSTLTNGASESILSYASLNTG